MPQVHHRLQHTVNTDAQTVDVFLGVTYATGTTIAVIGVMNEDAVPHVSFVKWRMSLTSESLFTYFASLAYGP